jgi:hypothetical protein
MLHFREIVPAVLVISWLLAAPARAFDLDGAWATSAEECGKVFTRERGKLGFTEMSDVYGGGFIVDGDQLIGKSARCKVKTRKESGAGIDLVAACASDIMLSKVEFKIKVFDDGSIARLFPDMEDMEVRYRRCPIK